MNENEYVSRVDEIKQSLYRIAYSYMNQHDLAMDVLDEAIYKGYLNRKKLKEKKYFKTWLTRIVMNECVSKLRKDKRLVFVRELPDRTDELFDGLPLKLALQTLPQELFQIISLRYFGGYTLAETGNILNVPLQTVASREKKALSLLRVELS